MFVHLISAADAPRVRLALLDALAADPDPGVREAVEDVRAAD